MLCCYGKGDGCMYVCMEGREIDEGKKDEKKKRWGGKGGKRLKR